MSLSFVHNLAFSCKQSLFKIEALVSSEEERVNSVVREQFENNFIYQKSCSFLIHTVVVLAGIPAYYFAIIETSVVSVIFAIITVAAAIFDYHRENNPNQLMRSALKEVENGNETKALELIQKGANLDPCSTETIWDFFSQFRDIIRGNLRARMKMPIHSKNIFDAAGYKRQKHILHYLASIGFDFKKTQILQKGDSLEIIQYLIEELSMPVNKIEGSSCFSPLYFQTLLMESAASRNSFEEVKTKMFIIRYLLENHACCEDADMNRRNQDLFKEIVEMQPGDEERVVQYIIDIKRQGL